MIMAILHLEVEDIKPLCPHVDNQTIKIMIDDVKARAVNAVPELLEDLDPHKLALARAVLRRVIARWAASDLGGVSMRTESAGPYSHTEQYDTRPRKLFYDDELDELRGLFPEAYQMSSSGAFGIDLTANHQGVRSGGRGYGREIGWREWGEHPYVASSH